MLKTKIEKIILSIKFTFVIKQITYILSKITRIKKVCITCRAN